MINRPGRARARSGRECFRQIDKTKLSRSEKGDLFSETAGVQSQQGQRMKIFEHEVAVAGRVHAVRGGSSESKLLRSDRAVERQRCTGNRSGAERRIVQTRNAVFEPRSIAQQHLDISEKPVRNKNRFGSLQMCIRRHHGFSGSLRQLDKCSRPFADVADEHARTRTYVQTQVGRNLLVAAAASM